MLTISQLASYAGVTVRAVRHYHATGLLPEPGRDGSGYRRYDAAAVVRLIRIRTLAEAGVPLARVADLLHADADEFGAAVADIDARLRSEIRAKQEHRRRIAQLAAGDSLALPGEAVDYLDRLRALGLPEGYVELERDAWILVAAHAPDRMGELMADKVRQLEDPEVVGLYREFAALADWEPDDPRLVDLADRLAAQVDAAVAAGEYDPGDPVFDPGVVDLLDAAFLSVSPVTRRLAALMRERGWEGWTHLTPVAAID